MSDFKKALETIKTTIKNETNIIKEKLNHIECTSSNIKSDSTVFDNLILISDKVLENEKALENKKGIYIFKMKEDYQVDKNFDKCEYASKISKNNNNNKTIFNKDKILYVGKSYKLYDRMKEHYSSSGKTYSLKLTSNERKGLESKCFVIILVLKEEFEESCYTLLPLCEQLLHSELKPLVGSSRI